MLTEVILEGPLGKTFGRKWELAVNSPGEALRMIDANRPGFLAWIKKKLDLYTHYRVLVEHADGRKEALTEETIILQQQMKRIRFVPVLKGAGSGKGQMIVGAILVVIGAIAFFGFGQPWGMEMMKYGAMMMAAGAITSLIVKMPGKPEESERKDKTSYMFDGPVNTTHQGVPVPLIYGRMLVGSHAISASVTADQLM